MTKYLAWLNWLATPKAEQVLIALGISTDASTWDSDTMKRATDALVSAFEKEREA